MTVTVRTIKQNNLTSECWTIQMQGIDACNTCKYKDTDECGGKEIRKTLQNEKGLNVPID